MFVLRSRPFLIYLISALVTLVLAWFLCVAVLMIPRGPLGNPIRIFAGEVITMAFACLGTIVLAPQFMAMWEVRRTRAKMLALVLGGSHILVSMVLTVTLALSQQKWQVENLHVYAGLGDFLLTPTAIICASIAVAGVAFLGPLRGTIVAVVVYVVVEGITLYAVPAWSPFPTYKTQDTAQYIVAAIFAVAALATAYVSAGSPPNTSPGQVE